LGQHSRLKILNYSGGVKTGIDHICQFRLYTTRKAAGRYFAVSMNTGQS